MFIGTERRLRGEAADQEWHACAKKGYKIAAAHARSTKDVENGKHTMVAIMITGLFFVQLYPAGAKKTR